MKEKGPLSFLILLTSIFVYYSTPLHTIHLSFVLSRSEDNCWWPPDPAPLIFEWLQVWCSISTRFISEVERILDSSAPKCKEKHRKLRIFNRRRKTPQDIREFLSSCWCWSRTGSDILAWRYIDQVHLCASQENPDLSWSCIQDTIKESFLLTKKEKMLWCL